MRNIQIDRFRLSLRWMILEYQTVCREDVVPVKMRVTLRFESPLMDRGKFYCWTLFYFEFAFVFGVEITGEVVNQNFVPLVNDADCRLTKTKILNKIKHCQKPIANHTFISIFYQRFK